MYVQMYSRRKKTIGLIFISLSQLHCFIFNIDDAGAPARGDLPSCTNMNKPANS